MNQTRLVYFLTLIVSILSLMMGVTGEYADLMMPGLIASILMVIIIHQSFKGKNLAPWTTSALNLTLALSMFGASFTEFTEYARFIFATPSFVAVGGLMLCCLIAYCNLRLDRAMISVFYLFLTLSVSNVFCFGVHIFVTLNGVVDEGAANFWLVDEFAFAFTFCLATLMILYFFLKKKNIRLVTSVDLLEVAK